MTTYNGPHCPECGMPGIGVHWSHCSYAKAGQSFVPTTDDIRRLVREEVDRVMRDRKSQKGKCSVGATTHNVMSKRPDGCPGCSTEN